MKYTQESWLREKYRDHTIEEMANMVGMSSATIIRYMDEHDIERRSTGVQQAEGDYKNKKWLKREYVSEERSTKEIADEFDVTKPTIKYWLEKHGIPIRSRSEAAKIRAEKHPHTHGRIGDYDGPNWWHLATEEERDEFREWLSERRKGDGNPMAGVTGEDHPHYKENPTPNHFYHSKKWKETREKALDRDGHKCQVCGTEDNLHVHHIHPMSAGGPRFELNNLVTLCYSHHKEWEGLCVRPDTRSGSDD